MRTAFSILSAILIPTLLLGVWIWVQNGNLVSDVGLLVKTTLNSHDHSHGDNASMDYADSQTTTWKIAGGTMSVTTSRRFEGGQWETDDVFDTRHDARVAARKADYPPVN